MLTAVLVKGNHKKGGDIANVQRVNQDTILKFKGLGIFKGDKLVGWFNGSESKGYNYVTGNIKSTVVVIPCEKRKIP